MRGRHSAKLKGPDETEAKEIFEISKLLVIHGAGTSAGGRARVRVALEDARVSSQEAGWN